MKPKKLIKYYCPSCKNFIAPRPTIMINQTTGESHLEQVQPRQCPACGTGLVRYVVKLPKERVEKNDRAVSYEPLHS